jgi:hypothetical protein
MTGDENLQLPKSFILLQKTQINRQGMALSCEGGLCNRCQPFPQEEVSYVAISARESSDFIITVNMPVDQRAGEVR